MCTYMYEGACVYVCEGVHVHAVHMYACVHLCVWWRRWNRMQKISRNFSTMTNSDLVSKRDQKFFLTFVYSYTFRLHVFI